MPAVYPIEKFPASGRGHYQHMGKRDVETWERFLARNVAPFVAFAYDVALGGLTPHGPLVTPAEALGWQYATALKIDAVAWLPDQVWVIEVKPSATVSALGAALAYTLVAQREELFEVPIQPVIVCDSVQVDVRWCCEQLGVRVIEVGT
jgi:hypothetical protein